MNHSRKMYFTRLVALILCLPCFLQAAEKPNILFILADDLGWADTTLYGHTDFYQTPNLERLASRGMTFERAYTSSPLCSPTRSSILTGLHPARTGLTTPNCHGPDVNLKASIRDSAAPNRRLTNINSVTRLDPKYETLSERLKAEGYATAHFGKWHLGSEPYSPLENGFDIDIPHWHGPGPAGSYVAPWKFKTFKEAYPGEHIEDRMGDEIVKYLEAQKGSDEPFFINYWQFSVHAPFNAKEKLIEKHRKRIDEKDGQRSPTYAAMVESLDDNVGKVLDALDRLDMAKETIIIFYSDNGGNMYNEVDGTTPTSNRPLRGGKGNNWDGGVRVPAVVVWPGNVKAGARNNDLITSTDLYPTLLDMLELKPSPDQKFDGVSILPALRGGELERDAIFTFFPHETKVPDTLPPSVAIYQGDWKLLRLFHQREDGKDELRLFNLAEDIGEQSEIASQHPERVQKMNARLTEFLEESQAVYPKLNPSWSPENQRITGLGWKAGKNCGLTLKDGSLIITSTGKTPNVNVTWPKAIAGGELKFRLRVRSTAKGIVNLRWSEKGVKPLYFKDRWVRSEGLKEEWQVLEIPFTAKKPMTGFRLDPPGSGGKTEIGKMEILRGNDVLLSWDFSNVR